METALSSAAIAVLFMLVLGLLLAGILAIASQRLFVFEDPRIDEVEEMLPHANCGACGTAGCRAFAELLVAGEVQPGRCTVNPVDMNQRIAGFLGVWPAPAAATSPTPTRAMPGWTAAGPRHWSPGAARAVSGAVSVSATAARSATSTPSP